MTDSLDKDGPEREALVLETGSALHAYGTPSHRIEAVLHRLSEQLGLESRFFSVPTAMIASFGPLGAQRTALVRLEPGGVDLGKLSSVDEVIGAYAKGATNPHDTLVAIKKILRREGLYPWWLTWLCIGFASGSGARFFGGDWFDIGMSLVIGLVLGLLALGIDRGESRHLFVPVAACLGALLSQAGTWLVGPYRTEVVTMAGLLYLLPGLTLTIALTELSTQHLVSGTVRLMSSILVLLEIGVGVALGSRLAVFSPAYGPGVMPPMPVWFDVFALVVAALSYAVLFRARPRDALAILIGCFVSFYAARVGATYLGSQLGAAFGAMIVSVACNVYGRVLNRPPLVVLLPAVLLLVPGSIGLRSITSILQANTLAAVNAAFEMALVGMSIAVGMLIGNLMSPRRAI